MIINEEHLEAYQAEVNRKLEEFKSTLPEPKKLALQKMQDLVGFCEQNNIPCVGFIKLMDGPFHQFNTFNEEGNTNRFSIDYRKKAWDTIQAWVMSTIPLMSHMYLLRIKLFSLVSGNCLYDTHPPKED